MHRPNWTCQAFRTYAPPRLDRIGSVRERQSPYSAEPHSVRWACFVKFPTCHTYCTSICFVRVDCSPGTQIILSKRRLEQVCQDVEPFPPTPLHLIVVPCCWPTRMMNVRMILNLSGHAWVLRKRHQEEILADYWRLVCCAWTVSFDVKESSREESRKEGHMITFIMRAGVELMSGSSFWVWAFMRTRCTCLIFVR